MAILPMVLYRDMLPDAEHPATVAVPAGKRWILTNLVLTNASDTSALPVSATIELDGVPLLAEATLDPGGVLTLDCAQVVNAGKTLTLHASTPATIAAHLSGVEGDM